MNLEKIVVDPKLKKMYIVIPQNESRNQPLILTLSKGSFEKLGLSLGQVDVVNCPDDWPNAIANTEKFQLWYAHQYCGYELSKQG